MSSRKIKKCIICGKDLTETKQNKLCLNKNCHETWNRLKYSKKEFKHICKLCNKEFITVGCGEKRVLCDSCKLIKIPHVYKKVIEQNVVCGCCGKVLYTQTKMGSRAKSQIIGGTCDTCKLLHKNKMSNRMKLNNPSYNGKKLTVKEYNKIQKEKEIKKELLKKKKIINRIKSSERMKLNNPMKNPETAQKASQTILSRIKDGTLKYKRGIERKGFKGSRTILQYFRFYLKNWRKENLLRSNYTCEICGKHGGKLHIHHKIQLSKIVDGIAKDFNIDLSKLEYGSDDYIKIEEKLLEYHRSNDIGLVVCADCHDKIDPHYHKGKGNGGYVNEIKTNK